MSRLAIAENFDSVINQIDLFTETKIQETAQRQGLDEEWWNRRRDEQLKVIGEIQQACLAQASRRCKEDMFVEYCFTVEYAEMLYLVRAKSHVESSEIEMISNRLRWSGP